MDFAVLMGDARTMIYKRGQGVVLNEPTVIAYTTQTQPKRPAKTKTLGVGKDAVKLEERYSLTDNALLATPVRGGRVLDSNLAGTIFTELFKKTSDSNLAIKRRCLFCVPCSLTPAELNDYKTVAYSAGVADADFLPVPIAGAVGLGYDVHGNSAALCLIIEDGITDIAVIKNAAIIDGGTVACECEGDCTCATDYKRMTDAVLQIIETLDERIKSDITARGILVGGRGATRDAHEFLTANLNIPVVLNAQSFNCVINGAGRLLDDETAIRLIVRAN